MLTQLTIKNYALIDDLNVTFNAGFTTITGETGAGKSILLGALSLVLGKRADLSLLRSGDKKCLVEAEFLVKGYDLASFFEENDLDYEEYTILRREILPSGKSRAFVNDSPVNLDILSALGIKLIDVHSQHQTLQLTENAFQFKVIDALAKNSPLLKAYGAALEKFKYLEKELEAMQGARQDMLKALDYNSFLLEELEKAPLKHGILEELEAEQEQLSNVETLMELLAKANQLLREEQMGILANMNELRQTTQRLNGFGKQFSEINDRIQSVAIELSDIEGVLENLNDAVEPNPQRLDEVNGQLQVLQNLFNKHGVSEIEELITLRESLAEQVDTSHNIEAKISEHQAKLEAQQAQLDELGLKISKNRIAVIPELKSTLEAKLKTLGMPSATFMIEVQQGNTFYSNGKDALQFLFSANKGADFGALKKVASGGELSRIMLVIKSIIASFEQLPTLMFDEIDTGVSGEISNRMGEIMKEMAEYMQVFSITHLPQVASKGNHQFKVYKEELEHATSTRMKPLSKEERITELAEMLGGKSYSQSAEEHARSLLL